MFAWNLIFLSRSQATHSTWSLFSGLSCFLFLSLRVLRPGFWLDAVALQARMPMQRTPGRRHAWPHLRWNFGLGFGGVVRAAAGRLFEGRV